MPSWSGISNARLTAFLGGEQRRQRHRRDGLRHLHCLLHEARGRHHPRHQSGALGLGGIHHASGQDQIHGLGLAERARQPLRSADSRKDAKLDLGLAELCRVGRDDEIALHGELAAAAQRKAGHRGNDRLARAPDHVPGGGEIVHEGIDRGLSRHLLDVGTGRERLLGAGDQHAADTGILVECRDRLGELGVERRIERIERLRPVEPDDTDAPVGLDQNVLIGHGIALALAVSWEDVT